MSKEAYNYALRLLSLREYSSVKLKKKLKEKKYEEEEISEALAELQEKNYLSDERYLKARVKQLAARGKAKRYIQQAIAGESLELAPAQIDEIFAESHIDEDENLRQVLRKKCQSVSRQKGDERKKYEKVLRFALSRGYAYQKIKKILKTEFKGLQESEESPDNF